MQYETTENESIETMTSIYDSHDRFNIVGPTPLGDCCDHIETMALVIVAIDNDKDLISVSSIVDVMSGSNGSGRDDRPIFF